MYLYFSAQNQLYSLKIVDFLRKNSISDLQFEWPFLPMTIFQLKRFSQIALFGDLRINLTGPVLFKNILLFFSSSKFFHKNSNEALKVSNKKKSLFLWLFLSCCVRRSSCFLFCFIQIDAGEETSHA